MDLLTGKGPSARHEIFYFGGPQLGAVRIDDFKFQFYPAALWLAWRKGDDGYADRSSISARILSSGRRQSAAKRLNDMGGGYMNDFYAREFWRFVIVQQTVGEDGADGHRVSRRCRHQPRSISMRSKPRSTRRSRTTKGNRRTFNMAGARFKGAHLLVRIYRLKFGLIAMIRTAMRSVLIMKER